MSNSTESGKTIQVFIDNNNPKIIYKGNWTNETGLPVAEKLLINPEDGPTPFYGTLSMLDGAGNGSFAYSFVGTAVTAFFTNSEAIFSCVIDGSVQNVSHSLGDIGRRSCSASGLSSPFGHTLTVNSEILGIDGTPLSFDGLFFTTEQSLVSELSDPDAAYIIPNSAATMSVAEPGSNALQSPGDTLSFQFHGASMGVYASFELAPPGVTQQPSRISYVIDEAIPVTVTIENPIMNNLSNITSQLIIQTPALPPGLHSFQMTFIGPSEHGIPIFPDRIITQSVDRNLTIVPNTSTNAGSNQQTTDSQVVHHRISRSTIIAISVSLSAAALLILVGVLWFWRRLKGKQKRRDSIPSPHPTENQIQSVVPFHVPHVQHREGFRISEYTTREKTSKYRSVYSGSSQQTMSPAESFTDPDFTTTPLSSSTNIVSVMQVAERQDQPRRPRYIVHRDAGNIAIPEAILEDGEEVVSLPPLYHTVGGAVDSYHT